MFIRTYLYEGHDVASAKDDYGELNFKGRMRNANISIIEIYKEECFIGNVRIPGMQSYHSIKCEDSGMTFLKYFKSILERRLCRAT